MRQATTCVRLAVFHKQMTRNRAFQDAIQLDGEENYRADLCRPFGGHRARSVDRLPANQRDHRCPDQHASARPSSGSEPDVANARPVRCLRPCSTTRDGIVWPGQRNSRGRCQLRTFGDLQHNTRQRDSNESQLRRLDWVWYRASGRNDAWFDDPRRSTRGPTVGGDQRSSTEPDDAHAVGCIQWCSQRRHAGDRFDGCSTATGLCSTGSKLVPEFVSVSQHDGSEQRRAANERRFDLFARTIARQPTGAIGSACRAIVAVEHRVGTGPVASGFIPRQRRGSEQRRDELGHVSSSGRESAKFLHSRSPSSVASTKPLKSTRLKTVR